MQEKKRVIVIGGGAAGMMAAIAAAGQGAEVILLEKNEKTGKKIYITGKGRCNLTNACPEEELFDHMISNPKFLYSAFYHWSNRAVMDFFEKAGCKLKEERGNRVFPVSDHSSDVIKALNQCLKENGVQVRLHTQVQKLLIKEPAEGEKCVAGISLSDGQQIAADSVILATGGLSYETTGSTGDGYIWAENMGHTVIEPRPALVPLTVSEDWCSRLQGLSLRNVAVTLKKGKKKLYEGLGEMLFTHFGVSGPLILSASSFYIKAGGKEADLLIDLKPGLDREQLDKRILRDFEENKNKQIGNSLGKLMPMRLIPVILELSGIAPDKKVNEITAGERQAMLEMLKGLPLTIRGTRGFSEAVITQGGVKVKEVDPGTMESKLVKGLFFAGEVLDVDALTGGFNLQIAWSTGYLAGVSAAQ